MQFAPYVFITEIDKIFNPNEMQCHNTMAFTNQIKLIRNSIVDKTQLNNNSGISDSNERKLIV